MVHNRELQLHDGKRIVDAATYDLLKDRFNLNEKQLTNSGIFKIHPDFRIIAIGEPSTIQTGNWLSAEVLSLFVFHEVTPLSKEEEMHIITSKVNNYFCFVLFT